MRSGTFPVITIITIASIAITLEPRLSAQHAVRRPIDGRPNALIDLRTADGVVSHPAARNTRSYCLFASSSTEPSPSS